MSDQLNRQQRRAARNGADTDLPADLQLQAQAEATEALAAMQPAIAPLRRRLQIFRFSAQTLISLGMECKPIDCLRGTIPKDARAINVVYDQARDTFGVLVESAEFLPVQEGCLIPWGDDPWFRIREEGDLPAGPAGPATRQSEQ